MNLQKFTTLTKKTLPVGRVIKNPGGGITTIESYTDSKVRYRRGASMIYVSLADLYAAYSRFRGQSVTSAKLTKFRPSVFSSLARPAGHSCNCTFLFVLLQRSKLSGPIKGGGVRGNPFTVKIHP